MIYWTFQPLSYLSAHAFLWNIRVRDLYSFPVVMSQIVAQCSSVTDFLNKERRLFSDISIEDIE